LVIAFAIAGTETLPKPTAAYRLIRRLRRGAKGVRDSRIAHGRVEGSVKGDVLAKI